MAAKSTPEELAAFGTLPDGAFVAQPLVEGLFQTSPTSVWRMCRDGRIPKPVKVGARSVRWQVGKLRAAMSAIAAA